jgi:hypothetical protein
MAAAGIARPLVHYVCLRRLRNEAPELFDGPAAVASIEECLRVDGYPSGF